MFVEITVVVVTLDWSLITFTCILSTKDRSLCIVHTDCYLKAQSWASLFSHSSLSIFHQKLVATNAVLLSL